MVDADLLLRIIGKDEATPTLNNVKNEVDEIGVSAGAAGESVSETTNALGNLSSGISGLSSTMQSGLSAVTGGRSLYDLTIGNSAKAETGKVLLQNIMQDTGEEFDLMYHYIDDLTNRSLVSLNMMMPALANFQASTGATNDQLYAVSDSVANFGNYVQASTGSVALAETAMNDLSKGLHGQFAALQRYKITEASLMNTGLWSGKEDDIDGYLAAVDQVIGKTDELMNTSEGIDQRLMKQFSVAGKSIANDFIPFIKDAKLAFIEWNQSVAESGGTTPAEYIVGAVSAFSTLDQGLGTVSNVITSIRDIKKGFEDAGTVIMNTTRKLSGWISKSEEVAEKTEGVGDVIGDVSGGIGKSDSTKGTGGITDGGIADEMDKTGEVATDVEEAGTKFNKADHVNQLKNIVMQFIKAAVVIAGIFLLIAEVLVGVWMEMAILSEIGKTYQANKGNIEAGIQGIIAIAPILIVIGAGVALLTVAMSRLGITASAMLEGGVAAGVAIAIVFGLISEVLLLMLGPILALAAVGFVYQGVQAQVQAGILGIQSVVTVFQTLGPVLLPLLAAIGLISIPGLGEAVAAALALGIPITMGLVAEFILSMVAPLAAIAGLGAVSGQLQGVEQGVAAIRQVTSALQAVQVAMGAMMLINFESFGSWVASGFQSAHDQMMNLVNEGGIITGIKDFIVKFNQVSASMQPINTASVQNLAQSANAIRLVSAAVTIVQASLMTNGGFVAGAVGSAILTPMLNQIRSMAQDLATFNTSINSIPIQPVDMGKVQALVQTGQSITRIKTTVDSVRAAVSSLGQAGGAAAANNGIAGVVGNALGGNGGSLKPALQQLLNAVDDVVWFNQQLASKTGGAGGQGGGQNLQGAANAVTQISNTIKQISTVLTSSAVKMRNGGLQIGRNITQGIRTGIGNLSASVTPQFNAMLNTLVSTSRSRGQQAGTGLKTSYTNAIKGLTTVTNTEIGYALQALANAIPRFREAGAALGRAEVEGYQREGIQQQSPGLIARVTQREINYSLNFLRLGQSTMYGAGRSLGSSLVSGFGTPNFALRGIFTDISNSIRTFRDNNPVSDINAIQDTNMGIDNMAGKYKQTIINVGEGAVGVDARNMTQRESQQIMIQAMESLQGVSEARSK